MQFTYNELAGLPGAQWLVAPSSGEGILTAICDDSRKLAPGALFIAIAGELTDGHRYVASAMDAGASGIIVEKEPDSELLERLAARPCPCLLVPDSLRAFQQLALVLQGKFFAAGKPAVDPLRNGQQFFNQGLHGIGLH